jgi:hypothetical protein
LDAQGAGSPRFGDILEDIVGTSPELAFQVYPVLRTDQQRLFWLSTVGDTAKKQGPSYLHQVPGFGARLAAIAHSMPKGYNRTKSLGIASRTLRKL